MDKKKLVLLVVALVVAVGTALMARSMFAGSSTPTVAAAEAPQGPRVLVAQRALPLGTIVTADSFKFKMWPEEMVQDAYFLEGEAQLEKLLGTVVRNPVTAGEPITRGALVMPGDRGFLAAALTPGMRAVTVPVSDKTAVAGFVFPGDRVDMVLTQTVTGEGTPLKAAETVLRNIRVLATDQATETTKVEGKTVVTKFATVTIEVTPRIAEKVAVAQTIGTLSLSLRSLADSRTELDKAIATGDVVIPDGVSAEQEEEILRLAMNRPQEGATTYQTGGHVSRFQRRSMPPQATRGGGGGSAPAPAPNSPTVRVAVEGAGTGKTGPIVRVTRGRDTTPVVVGK